MQPTLADWLARKSNGPAPKKRLPQQSQKMKLLLREYGTKATAFKRKHPICHVCRTCATKDVHHKRGRGPYLLDESTWLPVCRRCHTWIHDNPANAARQGFKLR